MEKQYLITKDEYQTVKQHWVSVEHHPAWHHIIYNILRSKPSDYGFTERASNFQGNDPWYGYNNPLREAQIRCSTKNSWDPTKYESRYEWAQKTIEGQKVEFKRIFGIDLPPDFSDHLNTLHPIGGQ